MGLVHIHKPEGLVSRKAQSKMRSKTRFECAIRMCDSNRCDSQVQSTGATHKCDQQVQLTNAINRCDSQARSTGVTHKCDQQVRLTSAIY